MENKTLMALEKLYKKLNMEHVLDDIRHDYLSECVCRNGREALWYMDESINVAIYTDTLEFLTLDEIDNQLC